MIKRRKLNDRVWVRKGAGFGGSEGEWAVIIEDPSYKAVPANHTLKCSYSCGDPLCREWPSVKADRDDVILRYITECEMYDKVPYHKRRRQHVGKY